MYMKKAFLALAVLCAVGNDISITYNTKTLWT